MLFNIFNPPWRHGVVRDSLTVIICWLLLANLFVYSLIDLYTLSVPDSQKIKVLCSKDFLGFFFNDKMITKINNVDKSGPFL